MGTVRFLKSYRSGDRTTRNGRGACSTHAKPANNEDQRTSCALQFVCTRARAPHVRRGQKKSGPTGFFPRRVTVIVWSYI